VTRGATSRHRVGLEWSSFRGFELLHGQRKKERLCTNAALGEFNDVTGDNFGDRIGAVDEAERLAGIGECHRHIGDHFWFKCLIAQEWSDWHGALRSYGAGARPVSQPPLTLFSHELTGDEGMICVEVPLVKENQEGASASGQYPLFEPRRRFANVLIFERHFP
jgi:hypothetical protein